MEKNIVLIGFMGSGKSTIAQGISKKFQMDVIEMDQEIVDREGMSISKIFETKGEAYFRDAETNLLIEMQEKKNVIISCGGGTPLREVNVVEMKKNGKVFFLTAKAETIYNRVKDSHDRPLLENNMNVEFIDQLLQQRYPKYQAAADYLIATDGRSVEEICQEIYEKAQ